LIRVEYGEFISLLQQELLSLRFPGLDLKERLSSLLLLVEALEDHTSTAPLEAAAESFTAFPSLSSPDHTLLLLGRAARRTPQQLFLQATALVEIMEATLHSKDLLLTAAAAAGHGQAFPG
jgi:hypothetical protein